jgi:deoxyribonuclease-1
MKCISKTLVTLFLFISFNANAEVDYSYYRVSLSDMAKDGHNPLTSYSQSRKYIMQQVHLRQDDNGYFVEDVYCHIDFREKVGPNRMPSHNDINIEHTWPQSRFNPRKNKAYQKADLHHLYPTQSRANSTRGNHIFMDLNDTNASPVNGCSDSLAGYQDGERGFEPPTDHKGNVARALFYFAVRYDISISPIEESFLRMWNTLDPVDEDERNRNDIIEQIQGNRNPFIDDPELVDLISDF